MAVWRRILESEQTLVRSVRRESHGILEIPATGPVQREEATFRANDLTGADGDCRRGCIEAVAAQAGLLGRSQEEHI